PAGADPPRLRRRGPGPHPGRLVRVPAHRPPPVHGRGPPAAGLLTRGNGMRRTHLALLRTTTATTTAAVLLAAPVALAPPAAAEDSFSDQCEYPNASYPGRPWSLQRVQLDALWAQSKGKGVRVAVIDTGVDAGHPQLKGAVDAESGRNFLPKGLKDDNGDPVDRGKENGTTDTVGHGTKVAGIIAARPADKTGFVGLAPEATIIPIQQNDADGNGDTSTLAK